MTGMESLDRIQLHRTSKTFELGKVVESSCGAINMTFQRLTIALMVLILFSARLSWSQEPAGKWAGRWSTYKENGRGHQGTLRVNMRPNGDGTYQGSFAGRFAVVLPYFYRATVFQEGDMLYSNKRLGPFGSYQMQLQHSPGSLSGGWTMGSEAGGILLYRR